MAQAEATKLVTGRSCERLGNRLRMAVHALRPEAKEAMPPTEQANLFGNAASLDHATGTTTFGERITLRQAQGIVKGFTIENQWTDVPSLDKFDHLHEELLEMSRYLRYKSECERIAFVEENRDIFMDGVGDLLFALLRLANQLGVDAAEAFGSANIHIQAKYAVSEMKGSERKIL